MNVYLFSLFALVSVGHVDLDDIDEAGERQCCEHKGCNYGMAKKNMVQQRHTIKQSESHAILQKHSYSCVIVLV